MQFIKTTFLILLMVSLVSGFMIIGCSDDEDDNGDDVYEPTDDNFEDSAQAAMAVAMMANTTTVAYSTTYDETRGEINFGGCPFVEWAGQIGDRSLTIMYADTCVIEDVSMSGVISGAWQWQALQGLDIDLDIQNFIVEDASTDGYVNLHGTALEGTSLTLNSQIAFTDTDGTETLTAEDLTAEANFNQTIDPLDDEYTLNGNGTYINELDEEYAMIFSQVKAEFMCFIPVSGTLTIESSDPAFIATVDFGDGACDTMVEVTIGNVTKDIDLLVWFGE